MVEELPRGIKRGVMDKLAARKLRIIEMKHEEDGDLGVKRIVYRKALAGKKEKGKSKDRISAFIVKAYESAILIQLGKFIGLIPEGAWEIEKEFQYTGTEIIWVEKSEFKTRWGLGDIYLQDNIKVKAHGSLVVRISDVKNFVMNVVSGRTDISTKHIHQFILEHVNQSFKDVLGTFTISDVIRSRESIRQKVHTKLFDLLAHWGIEVINLEVEGFVLPKEFDELGSMAMEKMLDGAGSNQERERMKEEIEKLKIQGELEAQRRALEGDKRDYMRDQDYKDATAGYENAKYIAGAKQVEGGVDVELLEKTSKAMVAGDVARIEVTGDKVAKIVGAQASVDEKNREKHREKKAKIRSEIAELKAKLDKFDDLIADGKITQEVYKMRVQRIEKDLRALENKL